MGLLESMSSGVQVVTTNVGMAPDFINKDSGLIVNSFDPKIVQNILIKCWVSIILVIQKVLKEKIY